jgi:hypothetical protein
VKGGGGGLSQGSYLVICPERLTNTNKKNKTEATARFKFLVMNASVVAPILSLVSPHSNSIPVSYKALLPTTTPSCAEEKSTSHGWSGQRDSSRSLPYLGIPDFRNKKAGQSYRSLTSYHGGGGGGWRKYAYSFCWLKEVETHLN